MVKIRKVRIASYSLITELMSDIRKADLKELYMGQTDPFTAVFDSIEASRLCYQARDSQGRLLALFGVGSFKDNINGVMATPVWMLGTNKSYEHKKAMVYYGKQFCREFVKGGPLFNFIWAGNEPAIRYIMHMGAELLDVVPMGRNGELFVPFILKEVR